MDSVLKCPYCEQVLFTVSGDIAKPEPVPQQTEAEQLEQERKGSA